LHTNLSSPLKKKLLFSILKSRLPFLLHSNSAFQLALWRNKLQSLLPRKRFGSQCCCCNFDAALSQVAAEPKVVEKPIPAAREHGGIQKAKDPIAKKVPVRIALSLSYSDIGQAEDVQEKPIPAAREHGGIQKAKDPIAKKVPVLPHRTLFVLF
jgi:hypothetical protein